MSVCYFAYSSKTNQRIAPIFTHSNDGASGCAHKFLWRHLRRSFLFDVGLTSSRRSKRLIRILSTKIRGDVLLGYNKQNYSDRRRTDIKPTELAQEQYWPDVDQRNRLILLGGARYFTPRRLQVPLTSNPRKHSGRRRTDIHPTLTPSAGYRSDVIPSDCVCCIMSVVTDAGPISTQRSRHGLDISLT